MSWPTTYAPGTGTAVVRAHCWLLLDLAPDDSRVLHCWEALAEGGADAVLEALLGGGLSAVPSFALVHADQERVRVIVRGTGRVSLTSDELEHLVESDTSATWSDRWLASPVGCLLSVAEHTAGATGLPLGEGVVAAALITAGSLRAAAADNDPVAPEALVEPVAPVEPVVTVEPVVPVELVFPVEALETVEALEPLPAPVDDALPDAAPEQPDLYRQLLGNTVDRDALLAQLRETDESGPAAADPEPTEAAPPPPVETTAVWNTDEDSKALRERAFGISGAAEDPAPAPVEPVAPAPPPSTSGLIDGLPWMSGSPAPSSPAPVTPPPPPAPVAPPQPVAPPPAPAAVPAPPAVPRSVAEENHVATVNRAALLASLGNEAHAGTTVLVIRCGLGHPNPPTNAVCRICSTALPDVAPSREARPPIGRLVLASGETVVLDRGVVLGRSPEHPDSDPATRPNLIRLSDSDEISRRHVEITIDGWQPLVRDLGSSNGTTVTLPGGQPQALRPQEDYPLEDGALITLADTVVIRFEVKL